MSALAEPLANTLSADEANARMAAGQRTAAGLEARLARQYESSLRATARRCAEAYRARTQVLYAASPPDDPQHQQVPQPTVDEVMKAELAAASATARTQATRRKMVQAVAGEILAGFGPEPQLRPLLEPIVRRQAGVQAERLVEGTRDAVANILLDALTEGWTVPETAAAIQSKLTEEAAWRATMLARTDLIALSNGAAQEAATILGDAGPQYKTWLTAGDDRVRPDHVDANRQTVGVNEPFQVGDSLLQYPGDPAGADEDTINCRCVSIFSDSPAPTLRHSQDGGIVDDVAVLASAQDLDDLIAGAVLDDLLASAFDEAKHPRHPKGLQGGRWKSAHEVQQAHQDRVDSGVSEFSDAVLVHGIDALEDGQGHGSAFLNDLIAYADDTGKPIYLTPQQIPGKGGAGLSTTELEAWYGRHGFVWANSKKMVREPGFSAAAWDESKHPRDPGGEGGGEFVVKARRPAPKTGLNATKVKAVKKAYAAMTIDELENELYTLRHERQYLAQMDDDEVAHRITLAENEQGTRRSAA